MSLIDNDLLSVQEARILLEHAAGSVEALESLPLSLVEDFLTHLREGLYQNARTYADLAFDESDYGNPQEEAQLIEWVLTDVLDDVCAQTPVQEIVWDTKSAAVYLSSRLACRTNSAIAAVLCTPLKKPHCFFGWCSCT